MRQVRLNEKVKVKPVNGSAENATKIVEINGSRRWVINGDPIEDWWKEIDEEGRQLPGEWEYLRDEACVICSSI